LYDPKKPTNKGLQTMKKLLLLGAAVLALQALPALAEEGGKTKRDGGKMMERIFTDQDANADGKISKDEFVSHAGKRFEAMDGNKDGSVTKEEIKAHHDAKKAEWKAKREAEKAPAEKPVDKPAE
jgi:hypothetical protein